MCACPWAWRLLLYLCAQMCVCIYIYHGFWFFLYLCHGCVTLHVRVLVTSVSGRLGAWRLLLYLCAQMCVCVCIYIYIYIYHGFFILCHGCVTLHVRVLVTSVSGRLGAWRLSCFAQSSGFVFLLVALCCCVQPLLGSPKFLAVSICMYVRICMHACMYGMAMYALLDYAVVCSRSSATPCF